MTGRTELPVRLGKSPLVEALFEVRFSAAVPASSVLPGILFTQLKCSEIVRLPQAEIPEQIRMTDPNLQYLPVVRLVWGQYYINIGDRNIVISSGSHYPGWKEFSSKIHSILQCCNGVGIIQNTQRFSLKYLDIFDMNGFEASGEGLAFSVNFPINQNHKATHVKIETPEPPRHHIIQFFGEAQGSMPNGLFKKGLMIDIDSIEDINGCTFDRFTEDFANLSDGLHLRNKELFFKLISESGMHSLEPVYE